MKAVVKTAPEPGCTIQSVNTPSVGFGEVLVKVKAVGICGSDLHIFEWTSGYEWLKDVLPLIIGHEFAGEVVQVGASVTQIKVGARVACLPGNPCKTCHFCQTDRHEMCSQFRNTMLGFRKSGALAEYISVPQEQCVILPARIGYAEAALLEPLVTAANAIDKSVLQVGNSVVVLGPGPIGLMLVMLAKASGCGRIIAVGTREDDYRLELAGKLGATGIVTVDGLDPVSDVLKTVGTLGADVVFEATGNPKSIEQGLAMLQKGKKMVTLGIHSSPVCLNLTNMVREGKGLIGSYSGGPLLWQRMISFMEENTHLFKPLISHTFPLNETLDAFRVCQSKKSGKVVVIEN